jgi:hypothetical protein
MSDKWSTWYRFSQLYEFYGFIDDTGGATRSKEVYTHLGKIGTRHQDDGFRLRSNTHPSTGAHLELTESLENVPCPLKKETIGCYWLRVEVPDEKLLFDYIGKCAAVEGGWGISKRLTDHFRKLCAIPDTVDPDNKLRAKSEGSRKEPLVPCKWIKDIRGVSGTALFSEKSADIKARVGDLADPREGFFDKYVKVKFIEVPATKTAPEKIHRIEGLGMATYKSHYGDLPHLNKDDETKGVEGFLPIDNTPDWHFR